jgi:hypothetical protein
VTFYTPFFSRSVRGDLADARVAAAQL